MSLVISKRIGVVCLTVATLLYMAAIIVAMTSDIKPAPPKAMFILPLVTMSVMLTRYLWLHWSEYRYAKEKLSALITAPVKRQSISTNYKRMVRERCHSTCTYREREGVWRNDPDGRSWNYDHVVPVSKGGITHPHNLTLSCSACNLRKADKTPFEYLRYLKRTRQL